MTSASEPPYAPYAIPAANEVYNLLFCDSPAAFAAAPGARPAGWQATLFAEPAASAALRALADDAAQEGRVRYLAYRRLHALGRDVPAKVLLGVVVEVRLTDGLDALAAYAEGGVRYINHSGRIAVFEGVSSLEERVRALFAAAEPVVARIGPWEHARKPPPEADSVRLTFLVSDGLYFGEGPMSVMQRDAMAGPIIERATELLRAVAPLAGT
ncbi:MAG: hypothetical protein IPM22_09915 [Betaproteobacteria bacterium]|jgi:hypothetical protein|nr:hypothetical protein [Betaproteobacteria bacterium]MCC7218938.1 hypothetical protein [Burkholderiales bacterium]